MALDDEPAGVDRLLFLLVGMIQRLYISVRSIRFYDKSLDVIYCCFFFGIFLLSLYCTCLSTGTLYGFHYNNQILLL